MARKMKAGSTKELMKFIYDEADRILNETTLTDKDTAAVCKSCGSCGMLLNIIRKSAKNIQQYAKDGMYKPDLYLLKRD